MTQTTTPEALRNAVDAWVAHYAPPHATRDYRPEDNARDIMRKLLQAIEQRDREIAELKTWKQFHAGDTKSLESELAHLELARRGDWDTMEGLRAQLTEANKDAERYRKICTTGYVLCFHDREAYTKTQFDEIIDAAIAADAQQEKA